MLLRPGCLEKYKLHESWDIEDLVKAGKKAKVRAVDALFSSIGCLMYATYR